MVQELCHPSLLNHQRINFAPYSRKPEALDMAVDKWLKSLWFKPAGFFENMSKESIKILYSPFWYFNVDVTTQYQGTTTFNLFKFSFRGNDILFFPSSGQVCKLVDDKGRRTETWHVSSGTRTGAYHGRLV